MIINLAKCVGCNSCVVKCAQEHFLPSGVLWGKLLIGESGSFPTAIKHVYPVLCNHCKEPKCAEVCPTGATQKREDGVIYIDADQCVGCRACVMACPYQVRTFHAKRKEHYPGQGFTEFEEMGQKLYPLELGTVVKCNFCMERIDSGLKRGLKPGVDRDATPACVITCPAHARYFGDLDDENSEISALMRKWRPAQLHAEFGTDPSVYYVTG
ncbi:MAG: 4Fe-4S dicluster domain-containing protein [Syntrophales bacterium]|jgi:Fe-S-cluster-containing dehydrogenase component|nr:4Fe-4S dicluster domain-containing protein [Syntrophales bacterium]